MDVWRIVKSRYAETAFEGEGAKRTGGRWSSPGRAAVYTSGTMSLAVLEILVHLGDSAILSSYSVIRASFDEHHVEEVGPLPEEWQSSPAPPALQLIGDEWLRSRRSLALRAPSVIVTTEWNYLINPVHEAFSRIRIGEPEPVRFDPRLVR